MEEAAKTYCTTRATSGLVCGIFLALSCCAGAYFAQTKMPDTSKYVLVKGKVVSGIAAPVKRKFKAVYTVEYSVNNSTYTTTFDELSRQFYTESDANAFIQTAVGSERDVWYDPVAPQNSSRVRHKEDWITLGLCVGASVLVVLVTVQFAFRNHPFFCGMMIASDASQALRVRL